ncbi:hypothetical protein [Desulfolucanica intricata]|uniref:hypothetical protein n=1 Tax=Desulfolucanica intricata TaxID=1285191 RepID=UPI000834BDC2|nr:hypothetical protein [Desulfolucanica intricata]
MSNLETQIMDVWTKAATVNYSINVEGESKAEAVKNCLNTTEQYGDFNVKALKAFFNDVLNYLQNSNDKVYEDEEVFQKRKEVLLKVGQLIGRMEQINNLPKDKLSIAVWDSAEEITQSTNERKVILDEFIGAVTNSPEEWRELRELLELSRSKS